MRVSLTLLGASLGSLLGLAVPLRATDAVIVHEWGTFTCLQDDHGYAIGGINVDDEPVPYFVSSVAIGVAPQYGSFGSGNLGLPPYQADKAWISGDPQVTMRLETPVLYIYPPKGRPPASVPPLDVHVDFHGGVLSQFYPHADFSGLPLLNFPEQPDMSGKFPYVDKKTGITERTTTRLDWKGVQLGSTEKAIETDDKVWTTPRETSAPLLQVKFSEPDNQGIAKTYTQAEHFLFYRGVGHLDSPLRLDDSVRGEVGTTTHLRVLRQHIDENETYPEAWLAEIHQDGTTAFRTVSSFGGQKREAGTGVHPLATVDLTFIRFLQEHRFQRRQSRQNQGLYAGRAGEGRPLSRRGLGDVADVGIILLQESRPALFLHRSARVGGQSVAAESHRRADRHHARDGGPDRTRHRRTEKRVSATIRGTLPRPALPQESGSGCA